MFKYKSINTLILYIIEFFNYYQCTLSNCLNDSQQSYIATNFLQHHSIKQQY